MMTNINVKNTIEVQGDVIPDTDNTRNLGTSSINWAETHTEDLYVYGNLVTDLVPNVSGVRDLGSSSNRWKDAYITNLYISGTNTFSGDISVSGSIGSDLIPNITGIYDLGSSTNKWKDAYITNLYISGTNTFSNVHVGDGSAANPAYSFEADVNTGLYRSGPNALSVSANGIEKLRVSTQPRAETSGSSVDGVTSNWTSLAAESFVAQSTGILITGDVTFENTGNVAMYVYSRVRLRLSGGADVAIGNAHIDGLQSGPALGPFNYASQSPSLAVTGLTPGTNYTVSLDISRVQWGSGPDGETDVLSAVATGLVNYVHG